MGAACYDLHDLNPDAGRAAPDQQPADLNQRWRLDEPCAH
jgi:hypothetical protein